MSKNYKDHDEYPRLLAGAHRRRFTRVGVPALTRYMVFWLPPRPASSSVPDTEPLTAASRGAQRSATDAFILKLYRDLLAARSVASVTNVDTNSREYDGEVECLVLFDSVYDASTGEKHFNSLVRPDSYRTIRFNFLLNLVPISIAFEMHEELVTVSMIVDASEIRPNHTNGGPLVRLEEHLNTVISGDFSKEIASNAYDSLYYEAWDEVEALVSSELFDELKLVGQRLLDFRGVILGTAYEETKDDIFQKAFQRPKEREFSLTKPLSREERERRKLLRLRGIQILWPFITSDNKYSKDNISQKNSEYVLCHFLNGRATYVSALGSQSDSPVVGNNTPLTYLLYTDRLNTWQLGRLVYRLHRAGSSRTVATMHFERLKRIGNLFREVELKLQVALSTLQSFKHQRHDNVPVSPVDLAKHYGDIAERLELALREYSEDSEPLTYRIERSRHYVAQFRSTAKALRIERIDGFQPYDEFVQQRLGSVFDFIDRLGQRYERIQNDRAVLLRGMQVRHSQEITALIANVQLAGDIALLGVLIPYYAASIVSHVMGEHLEETRLVWMLFLMFGGFYTMRKIAERREWFKNRPKRGRALVIALPIIVALAIYLVGDELRSPPGAVDHAAADL